MDRDGHPAARARMHACGRTCSRMCTLQMRVRVVRVSRCVCARMFLSVRSPRACVTQGRQDTAFYKDGQMCSTRTAGRGSSCVCYTRTAGYYDSTAGGGRVRRAATSLLMGRNVHTSFSAVFIEVWECSISYCPLWVCSTSECPNLV